MVELMRPFDIITFDCYGTLIDWESGIADAFRAAATADGMDVEPAAALKALFDTTPQAEAAEYRRYREVLTEAAVRVGARLGWKISRERASFLPESLPHWKPFPNTNTALERLSLAGYDLGILSNVDDDLLAETRRHFLKNKREPTGHLLCPDCNQPVLIRSGTAFRAGYAVHVACPPEPA